MTMGFHETHPLALVGEWAGWVRAIHALLGAAHSDGWSQSVHGLGWLAGCVDVC